MDSKPPHRLLALAAALALLAGAALAQVHGPASAHARGQRGTSAGLAWVERYDHGIAGHDSAAAVAVDSLGNAVVCGSSLGQYGGAYLYDTTTLKYAPDGALLWEQRYHGPGSGFNSGAVAVAIDASDDVYVLANDPGSAGNQDILLLKYDASGQEVWRARFDNNWSENGTALAVDAQGDVYVAGSSYYAADVTDVVLLKYDPSGTELWSRHWHGGFGTDWPVGLALDPHGNVDVVGNTINVSPGTNFDWVVLEYDPAGTLLWERRLSGALLAPDYANAMAVAPTGEVCATGYLVQTTGNQHHTTACWGDDGQPLWTHTFPTPTGGGKAVAFDAAGRAVVAGQAGVVAYDTGGGVRWQEPFTVPGAAWSTPAHVAVLPFGTVAVGGSGFFTGPGDELALALFDPAGGAGDVLVVGPPDVASASGMCASGARVHLAGSGSNGHDQDAITAAVDVH